ncbi:3-deoxy-7-phosphoheptulonate synthase [Micromonospora sp. NPDC048871]|uniref:3-deoxy-7-phosphoheptulonate synthase n=1 Tax=unclassified Micromonospora TaxID=2617518 RepID=UPI002E10B2D1|nr:3-deoxy-7-phosphoheptulonate synthase [Micromonospora sp. NBC_01739]
MHTAQSTTSRISATEPLMSPAGLRADIPLPALLADRVEHARHSIGRILHGDDDRLVVVAGPCSIHDPRAALTYAEKLAAVAERVSGSLQIVMRVYVEKPRTRLGWKGLVSDPLLDDSDDLATGLRVARRTMVDVLGVGLPVGCEFLDPTVGRYLSDLVSWGSIGARTVQSQPHRQLTSGLPMPVGFKNSTCGNVEDSIDAIVTAGRGHVYPGLTDDGHGAVMRTSGNPDCHVVLRGGADGPNFSPQHVSQTLDRLRAADLSRGLFIDASHGNCGKDHVRQPKVVEDLALRIADGERGIAGVMIESFLTEGRQNLVPGQSHRLIYGQSVTDSCVGWERTEHLIDLLADAVSTRRSAYGLAMAG